MLISQVNFLLVHICGKFSLPCLKVSSTNTGNVANPAHGLLSYFIQVHSNIIFPLTTIFWMVPFLQDLWPTPWTHLSSMRASYITHCSQPPSSDHLSNKSVLLWCDSLHNGKIQQCFRATSCLHHPHWWWGKVSPKHWYLPTKLLRFTSQQMATISHHHEEFTYCILIFCKEYK